MNREMYKMKEIRGEYTPSGLDSKLYALLTAVPFLHGYPENKSQHNAVR